jgi:hypothetical protein
MPVDDDLGDIVTPDIRWAYRPAGPVTGADPPPPGEGADAEQQATSSSRRRRAFSLIAISVIAISVTGLAYLSPTWTAKPETPPLKAAPTPASTPTAVGPLVRTFTSPTMIFSVKYPSSWNVTPATSIWRTKGANWTDAEVDLLDGGFVAFRGTSQALERGQKPKAWLDRYFASGSWDCPSNVDERVAVGDQIGVIHSNGCPSTPLAGQFFDLVLVAGGRGYNFTMEGAGDHAFFLSMLKTVTFGSKPPPEPIPTFSQTFTSNLMSYSMKYPSGWAAVPASQIWHGEWAAWNAPDVDVLDGTYVAFNGTSEPLARGGVVGDVDQPVSRRRGRE